MTYVPETGARKKWSNRFKAPVSGTCVMDVSRVVVGRDHRSSYFTGKCRLQ